MIPTVSLVILTLVLISLISDAIPMNGSSASPPGFYTSIIAESRAKAGVSTDGFSLEGESVDEFADIAKYMPRNPYRPRKQSLDESIEQYEARYRQGLKRYKKRRSQLAAVIRNAIAMNTDPDLLEKEVEVALQANRSLTREREVVSEAILTGLGMNRNEFGSIPPDIPIRQDVVRQGKDSRNHGIKARRYRKRYQEASEQDKEGILMQALAAGITLEEMMRRKYTPSIFDPRISDDDVGNGDDIGQASLYDDGSNSWHTPVDLSATKTISPDWLSLKLPGEDIDHASQRELYYEAQYIRDQEQQFQERMEEEQRRREFFQQQEMAAEAALRHYAGDSSCSSKDVSSSMREASES